MSYTKLKVKHNIVGLRQCATIKIFNLVTLKP